MFLMFSNCISVIQSLVLLQRNCCGIFSSIYSKSIEFIVTFLYIFMYAMPSKH